MAFGVNHAVYSLRMLGWKFIVHFRQISVLIHIPAAIIHLHKLRLVRVKTYKMRIHR